jgi:nicotinamide mononucleotide transporter
MLSLLSVNTIMITVGEYALSYIEFVGTILYFASVWLIARKNMLTWPIGIVSVILYGILFYQIQLYSDMIEQFYYLVVSVYGWIVWDRNRASNNDQTVSSEFSRTPAIIVWASATLILAVLMSLGVARFHLWLPRLFPVAADYPFLDALTTVMSFAAMLLMARRRTESWVYWIIVDVIGIGLYWVKDVRFIAIQYVVLLGMAAYGLLHWVRRQRDRGAGATGAPADAGTS